MSEDILIASIRSKDASYKTLGYYRAVRSKRDKILVWKFVYNSTGIKPRTCLSGKFKRECLEEAEKQGVAYCDLVRQNDEVLRYYSSYPESVQKKIFAFITDREKIILAELKLGLRHSVWESGYHVVG